VAILALLQRHALAAVAVAGERELRDQRELRPRSPRTGALP